MTPTTPLQHTDEWTRYMRRGDWPAAWRLCDQFLASHRGREPRDAQGQWLPRHRQWVWDGTPLAGKRILVRCYHGLGDTLQFIRFVPQLKESPSHLTVWAQPLLLPLLENVGGIDALQELHDDAYDGEYDVDIEVMELAHALRITPQMLPGPVPYIHVNDNRPRSGYSGRPRVGLVWQSGSWDPQRSVPPHMLDELTQLEGLRFQIFQRGPALARWRGQNAEIPTIHNIVAEAAALRQLDLLISVDTFSAHLAGALGVRTWTLLPASADWRWMEDREDTPWYPTMRLFRQIRSGEWETVIARLKDELARVFDV